MTDAELVRHALQVCENVSRPGSTAWACQVAPLIRRLALALGRHAGEMGPEPEEEDEGPTLFAKEHD